MLKNISKNIDGNIQYLKEKFTDCDDLVVREIEIGDVLKVKLAIVFIDGLISTEYVADSVIGSLLREEEIMNLTLQAYKTTIFDAIKKQGLYSTEIKDESQWDPIIDAILSGDTVLLINDSPEAMIIGTRGGPGRSIGEPQTETVIRGPRDGFTETFKFNITMVRRRIKDTKLKVKYHTVGRRSKTSVAVMYIDDIVNPQILEEVNKRLADVDIDAVIDSSILENLIEDNYLSPFPQIENTERPDSVAASLYEGRVALIVDNTPFALIVPATVGTLMQSSEDYYTRYLESSAVRIIRHLGLFLLFTPGPLYVAYFVAVSSYISRLLGDLIKGFLLTRTPIQLTTFIFIAAIAYAAVSEIDVIARIAYIIYPITIAFVILLFLLALPGADFTNILPIFQSDISKLPEGMWVAVFSYSGFEILLFALPYVEDKDHKSIVKASILGILTVIVLYLILFIITLTQFSVDQIISDQHPVLIIAKLIDLPGFFLQNLDGLVMAIWILLIFSTVLPLYYSSGKILSKIFKRKSHKLFILILIPIIYFVAYIPDNILQLTNVIGTVINYLGVVTILVIPSIILIVGRLRKGGEKQ